MRQSVAQTHAPYLANHVHGDHFFAPAPKSRQDWFITLVNIQPELHDFAGQFSADVNTGASLRLQMHHHRAEHWVVVRGTAEVTRGSEVFLLSENQSTFIPLGKIHRLRNPGKTDLEMIEVLSGGYLGEDAIVRFEDEYGRTPQAPAKTV